MNSVNYKTLVGVFLLILGVASCVQDDDFTVSPIEVNEPIIEGTIITVDGVVDVLLQEINDQGDEEVKVTFEETGLVMEGYVISSDRAGNFFEELILQDRAENPTAGIRVPIDINPLYVTYEFGRKIYIKLDGLTVGIENGVPTLGVLAGDAVDQIPSFREQEFITRSAEVATIVPLEIAIEDFSDDFINLYLEIDEIQFRRDNFLSGIPLSYAGEPSDEFDGQRLMESCVSGKIATLLTSTFADFKSLEVSNKQGNFTGILTKNFFGDEFVLTINTIAGIDFVNERCSINCGLTDVVGSTNIFSDDFENQTINMPISGNGWMTFQEVGTETWEAYSSVGTNSSLGISARVSPYRSGDESTVTWLITPIIDLDQNDGETLHFKTSNSFADGSNLELLYSDNWDGNLDNILNARWICLSDAYIVQDSDFFGDWFESGIVDLSCLEGTVHLAFRYTGSGNEDFDGTYELDEISIDAK